MPAISSSLQLPYLGIFDAVDRRVRTTATGIEIVTTFYVEPATAAPIVTCALLGSVDAGAVPPTRTPPAADGMYPFCYCVEVRESPLDKRAASSNGTLLSSKANIPAGSGRIPTWGDLQTAISQEPISFNGPQTLANPTIAHAAPGMCGCYLEAVYRPLPTIYTESGQIPLTWANPQNAFDYVDPQFYPCSRSFDTGPAGFLLPSSITGHQQPVPGTGLGSQIVETWQEFTIRRVMCPTVPWQTIRMLENRINGLFDWIPANMTVPGLPSNTFPVFTLRFDSAEPIKRTMPYCFDTSGKILIGATGDIPITRQISWWDILYKFSWRTTWAEWTDHTQTVQGPSFIPWNCDWFNGTNNWIPGTDLFPGWYEMTYFNPKNAIIVTDTRAKYLNAEDSTLPINSLWGAGGQPAHPFDLLFLNSSP